MGDELQALRDANDRFYRALESLDLATMDAVWHHEGWVRCIHPGWDAVVGWPAVRQSWEQVFRGTRWMRVTPTDVEVQVYGPLGVVACAENITAGSEGEVGVAVAQATNLFLKTAEGWRIIHHHASSAPVQVTQPFSGTIQ